MMTTSARDEDRAPALDQHGEDARGPHRVPRRDQGTVAVEFSTLIDGPLLRAVGEAGELHVDVEGGRLSGRIVTAERVAELDAEDALGLADGRPHAVALTVDDSGTHLYCDGYEAFSSTATAWFDVLGAKQIAVDPQRIMDPTRVRIWRQPLTSQEIVAITPPATSWLEFAASALSARDARRCSELTTGALRARVRLRGRGQGGTVLEAHGSAGTMRLAIDRGDITFTVTTGEGTIADVRAPGQWDDGDWHDLVVVSGRGAIDVHVDGFQVVHAPGEAFLSELATVDQVVVGASIQGSRLFGEAQTAMIYDVPLSDHQVKRLASVRPLETRALFDTGYLGSRSYRIPSLLRLESGVLLAGADQRVSIANDSPNDINFVLRRSEDDGRTWSEPEVLIEYPGSGHLGASVIDSVLLQDRSTGRVIVLIDQFPGGIGQPNCAPGTGFTPSGERILEDREGVAHLLRADGTVVTAEGEATDYRVEADGSVLRGGAPAGNIHLADGVDPAQSLLSVRTAYLQMITSDDDGVTWSEPVDLTSQLKEDWMRFLGTSPGNGIQLRHGPRAGRLLAPIYFNHEEGITFSCAAAYSDDGGTTWHRGASPNDGRIVDGTEVSSRHLEDDRASLHESALVEAADGSVHVYMRNQHPSGRVAHAVSEDGGETWGEVDFVEELTEIFSQPNAITVTDEEGREAVVFANASQMLPFRGCGVLRMSYDDGATWPHNRVLTPRHHVYQCMAQVRPDTLGVLWEREWQGLFYTEVPLTWLTASRSTTAA